MQRLHTHAFATDAQAVEEDENSASQPGGQAITLALSSMHLHLHTD